MVAEPGFLRFSRQLDRRLMVGDHGVDEGAIERHFTRSDRRLLAAGALAVIVAAAAGDTERDQSEE